MNYYLDDWLRAWETKILTIEVTREVIDLREKWKVYGQYFLGELLRKNGSISWVKKNNRKLRDERKNLTIESAKGREVDKVQT
jgi:hypothetical protein